MYFLANSYTLKLFDIDRVFFVLLVVCFFFHSGERFRLTLKIRMINSDLHKTKLATLGHPSIT